MKKLVLVTVILALVGCGGGGSGNSGPVSSSPTVNLSPVTEKKPFAFNQAYRAEVKAQLPAYRLATMSSLQPSKLGGDQVMANLLTVADFNRDGLDDVVTGYFDTWARPNILLGATQGNFTSMPIRGQAERRGLHSAQSVDINNDGWVDLLFTSVPHPFYASQGSPWNEDSEPLLMLINRQGLYFDVVNWHSTNKGVSRAIDLDGDGLKEILEVSHNMWNPQIVKPEFVKQNQRRVYKQVKPEQFELMSMFPAWLDQFIINDILVTDVNKDQRDDLVLSVSPDMDLATPGVQKSHPGTIAIILYNSGSSDLNTWSSEQLGPHWITKSQFDQYKGASNSYNAGGMFAQCIDIVGDSQCELVVGTFLVNKFLQETSGFQVFKRTQNSWVEITNEIAPNQMLVRNIDRPTPANTDLSFYDFNQDGYKDLVFFGATGSNIWLYNPERQQYEPDALFDHLVGWVRKGRVVDPTRESLIQVRHIKGPFTDLAGTRSQGYDQVDVVVLTAK